MDLDASMTKKIKENKEVLVPISWFVRLLELKKKADYKQEFFDESFTLLMGHIGSAEDIIRRRGRGKEKKLL